MVYRLAMPLLALAALSGGCGGDDDDSGAVGPGGGGSAGAPTTPPASAEAQREIRCWVEDSTRFTCVTSVTDGYPGFVGEAYEVAIQMGSTERRELPFTRDGEPLGLQLLTAVGNYPYDISIELKHRGEVVSSAPPTWRMTDVPLETLQAWTKDAPLVVKSPFRWGSYSITWFGDATALPIRIENDAEPYVVPTPGFTSGEVEVHFDAVGERKYPAVESLTYTWEAPVPPGGALRGTLHHGNDTAPFELPAPGAYVLEGLTLRQ